MIISQQHGDEYVVSNSAVGKRSSARSRPTRARRDSS
jgi:hypothetical protein